MPRTYFNYQLIISIMSRLSQRMMGYIAWLGSIMCTIYSSQLSSLNIQTTPCGGRGTYSSVVSAKVRANGRCIDSHSKTDSPQASLRPPLLSGFWFILTGETGASLLFDVNRGEVKKGHLALSLRFFCIRTNQQWKDWEDVIWPDCVIIVLILSAPVGVGGGHHRDWAI